MTTPRTARASAVVINPTKVADLDAHRIGICDALGAAGWPEPLWLPTTSEDSGRGQTRQAIDAGVEVVFVCGGDGTVMACAGALSGTDVAMAVIPSGTGNLLAANMSLPHDIAGAVGTATTGRRRIIDVGRLDGYSFTVMAGIGFDAEMLSDTSPVMKRRIGWIAYLLGALKHLRDRPIRLQITLDDQPPMHRRARTVLIANVGKLQGGIRLFPDAEPDDGILDIGVLNPTSLRHWAMLGWAVLRRHPEIPRMETFRAQRVDVVSNRIQSREVDGDVIEPGRRLHVAVRSRALILCVQNTACVQNTTDDPGS